MGGPTGPPTPGWATAPDDGAGVRQAGPEHDHPTTKPADLFAYLIGNSCKPGGLVLDPFGGSGTSLVAAEQTGRAAALVELDPKYCDVVVSRFEGLTGQKAERAGAA